MTKSKFVRVLAFFVAIVGLLVAIGWVFDIGFLRDIPPGAVPMKFTTAVCFVAGSVVLFSSIQERSESSFVAQMVLPSAILLILLVMVTLLVSSVFGFHSDLDIFLVQEKVGENTVTYGRAAIPSMVNFILIAFVGILFFAGFKKHFLWLGTVITIIGGAAALGHVANQPFLYFPVSISGISTGMAFLSAILFILVGIGFILCGNTASKQN